MPDISTPNLDYGNMVQAWDINDALMGGTLYMRQLGEAYMPRWPKEDKEDYKKRLAVATLLPAYEETINQNVGRVFAEPVQLGENVPDALHEFVKDVDLEGSRLDVWAQVFFSLAMQYGLSHALVDYPRVSNQSALMTCAWSGRITVNGSTRLPVNGIPFGKWNNPNVSVGFDGTNIIVRNISYTGRDDLEGIATIDLVIFNQTAPVGGDGITMTNAAGQVTFSTVKRPFVYDRQIQITDNFQNIGGGFCQIVYTGAQVRMNGGYGNLRIKGVVMSGGSVRSAYNRVFGNYYSNGWDMTRNRNITMPILILPDMY